MKSQLCEHFQGGASVAPVDEQVEVIVTAQGAVEVNITLPVDERNAALAQGLAKLVD